jgi:hypothetical protein
MDEGEIEALLRMKGRAVGLVELLGFNDESI